MSVLTVENLTHSYGEQFTFKDIHFRLFPREHAGLVGVNGAGKSTLLRILSGELLPDSGKIQWEPHKKVGYLQQHLTLRSGISVMQFLQTAFAPLYELEKKIIELTEKMASADQEIDSLLAKYGELQAQLDSSDFYKIDALVKEVADGLGITELGMDRDVAQLSGGQRTKLLLGKLLLEKPDVLLLDEPTNYLDDAHITWLTGYLQSYPHAYLVVSHDERFLNEVTSVIYHLENQTITRYPGNYQSFLQKYEQSKAQQLVAYKHQQREIQRMERFIEKNRNRKAKQAKSREKMLHKMEKVEKPTSTIRPRFSFRVHRESARQVLVMEHLQIGYTEPLFPAIHQQVLRGEKIAIVGHNGIGKSTLLKTFLGYLPPLGGKVRLGEQVKPAYFAQEETGHKQTITPLEWVWSYRPDLTQKEIRQKLAMSGLQEKHVHKSYHSLSGGEQAKVRLTELMLSESNLLVLDEPTNHLDLSAKEALKEALKNYQGTILLVSHEPEFYQDWVTNIWQVEEWSKKI